MLPGPVHLFTSIPADDKYPIQTTFSSQPISMLKTGCTRRDAYAGLAVPRDEMPPGTLQVTRHQIAIRPFLRKSVCLSRTPAVPHEFYPFWVKHIMQRHHSHFVSTPRDHTRGGQRAFLPYSNPRTMGRIRARTRTKDKSWHLDLAR